MLTCRCCLEPTTVAVAYLAVDTRQAQRAERGKGPPPEWAIVCDAPQCPPEAVQLWWYWFPAREAIDKERPHGGWRAHLEGKTWFAYTDGYNSRLAELRAAAAEPPA